MNNELEEGEIDEEEEERRQQRRRYSRPPSNSSFYFGYNQYEKQSHVLNNSTPNRNRSTGSNQQRRVLEYTAQNNPTSPSNNKSIRHDRPKTFSSLLASNSVERTITTTARSVSTEEDDELLRQQLLKSMQKQAKKQSTNRVESKSNSQNEPKETPTTSKRVPVVRSSEKRPLDEQNQNVLNQVTPTTSTKVPEEEENKMLGLTTRLEVLQQEHAAIVEQKRGLQESLAACDVNLEKKQAEINALITSILALCGSQLSVKVEADKEKGSSSNCEEVSKKKVGKEEAEAKRGAVVPTKEKEEGQQTKEAAAALLLTPGGDRVQERSNSNEAAKRGHNTEKKQSSAGEQLDPWKKKLRMDTVAASSSKSSTARKSPPLAATTSVPMLMTMSTTPMPATAMMPMTSTPLLPGASAAIFRPPLATSSERRKQKTSQQRTKERAQRRRRRSSTAQRDSIVEPTSSGVGTPSGSAAPSGSRQTTFDSTSASAELQSHQQSQQNERENRRENQQQRHLGVEKRRHQPLNVSTEEGQQQQFLDQNQGEQREGLEEEWSPTLLNDIEWEEQRRRFMEKLERAERQQLRAESDRRKRPTAAQFFDEGRPAIGTTENGGQQLQQQLQEQLVHSSQHLSQQLPQHLSHSSQQLLQHLSQQSPQFEPDEHPQPAAGVEEEEEDGSRVESAASGPLDPFFMGYPAVYRLLNPNFPAKLLSHPAISNRIDPLIPLCPYQLNGRCADRQCPYQHEEEYLLSEREIVEAILGLWPKLCPRGTTPVKYAANLLAEGSLDLVVQFLISKMPDHVRQSRLVCGGNSAVSTPLFASRLNKPVPKDDDIEYEQIKGKALTLLSGGTILID